MKKLVILGMVGMSLCLSTMVQACPITLLNDIKNPIQVWTNDKSNETFMLPAGKTKSFGSHEKHTQFSVLEKDPNKRAELIMEIRQHSCSQGKSVELKASDLLAGKFDKNLFNFDTVKNGTSQNAG